MQYKTGTRRVFCWEIHLKCACFSQGPKPKWKIGHFLHSEELVAWTLILPHCSPLGWFRTSIFFFLSLILFCIWMPDAQFTGLPASGTHEKGSKWIGFFLSRWYKTMCTFSAKFPTTKGKRRLFYRKMIKVIQLSSDWCVIYDQKWKHIIYFFPPIICL